MIVPCRWDEYPEGIVEWRLQRPLPENECSEGDRQSDLGGYLHFSETFWPAASRSLGHYADRLDSALKVADSAWMSKKTHYYTFLIQCVIGNFAHFFHPKYIDSLHFLAKCYVSNNLSSDFDSFR